MSIAAIIIILGGAWYALHKYLANKVSAEAAITNDEASMAHVAAQEKAAAAARAKREKAFDDQAAAVHTADDAIALLRSVLPDDNGPKGN